MRAIDAVREAKGIWASGADRARLSPLDDGSIRDALRSLLCAGEPIARDSDSHITEEFALDEGYVRADFVVISPAALHILEIKSDRDRLYRLPDQARAYNRVADIVTLVVGWRHAVAGLRQAPWWWEIWLADPLDEGGIQFVPLRAPDRNPCAERPGLARLLPRDTALAMLTEVGADRGARSKPRAVIQDRLVSAIGTERLRANVFTHLRARDRRAEPPSR